SSFVTPFFSSFYSYCHPLPLHSFPTRRSSDLYLHFHHADNPQHICYSKTDATHSNSILTIINLDPLHRQVGFVDLDLTVLGIDRSEEHTSELQSRENLVCRLLLEKKKNKKQKK